jgi:hypothetical protein
MKQCIKCNINKSLEDFPKSASSKDGKHSYCKKCMVKQRMDKYERKNKVMKITETHKQCRVCEELLSFDNYSGKKNPYCKKCNSYLGHIRNVRKYGIDVEDYINMLKNQDYACAICKRKTEKRLAVDHDHNCCAGENSCGKCIRGLLCFDCNIALGMLKDNIATLTRMINYLSK